MIKEKNNSNKYINLLKKVIKGRGKIKIDSRDITPGDIFIALKGPNGHGVNYIQDAIKRKASYIISDKKVKNINNNKIIFVDNCLRALKFLAKNKRSMYKGKVIGITGSVGKTSTKEQLSFFLNFKLKTNSSIKSYNNNLGVCLTLANLDLDSKVLIIEIGTNNFGEIKKLALLARPNIAIITNIGPTHLKNFKNLNNIIKEKSEIFNNKFNPNIKSIVIPYSIKDNSYIKKIIKKNKTLKVLTFGDSRKANVFSNKIIYSRNKIFIVKVNILDETLNYKISANGKHQVQNNLIVLSIFYLLKLNYNYVKNNATSLPELSGRGKFYKIKLRNKKFVLIDESYNSSPLSLKATIDYFNEFHLPRASRKFLIIGDMLELGAKSQNFHLEISKYLNPSNFYQILTCGNLVKILNKHFINENNFYYFKDINKLNNHFLKNIRNRDMVLVKCSNNTIVNKFVEKLKIKRIFS